MFFMEEQYKGHVIRVTTEKDNIAFPCKPICRILMERRESLLNSSTGRLVTTRLIKNMGLMLGSDQAKFLLGLFARERC